MNIFDLIETVVVNVIKSITTVINLITVSVKKSLNDVRAKTKSSTNTRIESRISSSNQTLKTDENGRLRIEPTHRPEYVCVSLIDELKGGAAMSTTLNVPNFSFGATAVIRPLPGGTREALPSNLSANQLKVKVESASIKGSSTSTPQGTVLTSKPSSRGRPSRKRRLVSRKRTPSTRNRATNTNPKKRKRKQN